jgi:serine protease
VAAVDYNFAQAWYSTSGDYVEIAAPGGDNRVDLNDDGEPDGIVQQTLDPDFTEKSIFSHFALMLFQGTSMATPHVAAMGALLYDQGITSPAAIEAAIKATATNKPSAGRNNEIGYGVINVPAALRGMGLAK